MGLCRGRHVVTFSPNFFSSFRNTIPAAAMRVKTGNKRAEIIASAIAQPAGF
jgi:hypothetical protein